MVFESNPEREDQGTEKDGIKGPNVETNPLDELVSN